MCLHYVQYFIAKEGVSDSVLARPGFSGNRPVEMCGEERRGGGGVKQRGGEGLG